MTRRGMAVALLALLSVAATTPPTRTGTGTVDVFLKERGDDYFAGEDLLSSDGAGQSRSLITRGDTTLVIRIQNDSGRRATITVTASAEVAGFDVRYRRGRVDVTDQVLGDGLRLEIAAGASRTLRALVDASEAPFAAQDTVVVRGVLDDTIDASRAQITKIS